MFNVTLVSEQENKREVLKIGLVSLLSVSADGLGQYGIAPVLSLDMSQVRSMQDGNMSGSWLERGSAR